MEVRIQTNLSVVDDKKNLITKGTNKYLFWFLLNNFCTYRDGSEKSWSDNSSEKSWKKSPRNTSNTKSEFKPKFGGGGGNNKRLDNKPRNFNKSSPNFSADTGGENTWNISSVPDLPDLAPNDAVYEILQLTGSTNNVTISWFHNPSHFYCQLLDMNVSIIFCG